MRARLAPLRAPAHRPTFATKEISRAVSETTDGLPLPQRRRAMLTLAIALSMSVLDGTIANVALPTIAQNLDVSPAASIWVVNSFQIAVMISLLPLSSLGDIYGYRRVYTIGLAVFTAASLFSALSTSLLALSLSRALQGFGGAGLMSVNTALIRYIFPRAQLGRGMGFNALIVATSSALGPTVAAAILSVASWPWLFLVNVPFGILALVLCGALPASRRATHDFDFPGAALNAGTFALFIAALDGLGHGGGRAPAIIELAAFAVVGTLFVRRQQSLAAPMLPIDLFRRPIFALTVATSVCSFTGQTIAYVALPFLFQAVGGVSETGTGLLMTPWPATVAVIAPIAGRLSDRYPAGLLGGLGLAAMCAGMVLIALLPEHAAWGDVVWRMALAGAGFGFFQSPNNRLLISSVPHERSGAGSGILSSARLLGQTTGAALVAVCFGLTEAGGVGKGALVAITLGAAFCGTASVLSSLRLVRTARD